MRSIRTILRVGVASAVVASGLLGGQTLSAADGQNVVQTAIAAGSFKTLVAAIQAADLADALQGPGPFTVFAPTDEAFAKLPPGALDGLLKDKAKLQAVLKYHVVAGRVTAAQVVQLKSATTLNGQSLTVEACDGVKVGGAKVLKTDILCSNGVVHVIDRVLLPK